MPPGGPIPSRPRRRPAQSFFDSVRRTGLVRVENRWFGGVAGGVARRLGVDPVLVRCVWVVVTILSGIGLILYGVGWALMPEERDGRIHLEQALVGDVNAGLAGAIASVVVGLATVDHGLIPEWYLGFWDGTGLFTIMWVLLWTLLIVGILLVVVRIIQSGSRRPQGPPQGPGPMAAAPGQPGPATGAAFAPGTGGPSGTSWQQAAWDEGAAAAQQSSSAANGSTPVFSGEPLGGSTGGAGWSADGAGPSGTVDSMAASSSTGSGPDGGDPAGGAVTADSGHGLGAGADQGNPARPLGSSAPGSSGWPPAARPGSRYAAAPSAGPSAPQAGPMMAGPRPPRQRPQIPGPGRTISLLVLGLALLVVAGLGLAQLLGHVGQVGAALASVGGLTLLLGLGVIISGLRGRRGGWMTWFGWLAAAVCVPLIALGAIVPHPALRSGLSADTVTLTWSDVETRLQDAPAGEVLDLSSYTAGSVTLDLRDMPADALSTDRTVRVWVGAGELDVRTGLDEPVQVDVSVGLGSVNANLADDWTLNGTTVSSSPWGRSWQEDSEITVDGEVVSYQYLERRGSGLRASFTSPTAQQAAGTLVVNAEVGVGSAWVSQSNEQTTWWGNADEEVWIVDSWQSASGVFHEAEDTSTVPGMTHPAISDETAEQCLVRAGVEEDLTDMVEEHSNAYSPQGSRRLPLSPSERTAYDDCVDQALADGRGLAETSAATDEPTDPTTDSATDAATSPEPSDTPTN